jgi:hypothetical protein
MLDPVDSEALKARSYKRIPKKKIAHATFLGFCSSIEPI